MIIGVDQSFTATGVAVIDCKGAILHTEKLGKHMVGHEAIAHIVDMVDTILQEYWEGTLHTHVACEQPPYSKGMSSSYQMLCALYGVLVYAFGAEGVNPASWKSYIAQNKLRGIKKATKAGAAEYCRIISEIAGYTFDDTDIADAWCIAEYMRRWKYEQL